MKVVYFKILIVWALLLFITTPLIFSEEYNEDSLWMAYSTKPKFGVFANYGLNLHLSNFRSFPDIPCCSPKFSNALGWGWEIGGLAEHYINDSLSMGFRLSLLQNDGEFKREETTTVIVDGVSRNGIFEHQLKSWITYISAEFRGNYNFRDFWWASAGLGLSFAIKSRFHQKEIIVEPSDRGVFPDNGLRVRNEYSGLIPEVRSVVPYLSVGISAELLIHRRGMFFLYPEFNYKFHFINQVRGISWLSQQFRLGIALKYREPIPPPPPPPPPIEPPIPAFPKPVSPPTLEASITYTFFDSSGVERKNVPIKIEDFVSLNMKPLLNYVFFDHNSDVIPSRYVLFTPQEAEKFRLESLAEKDILQTYYYILNIVGKKLKEDPTATVTLVGTNSGKNEEKNNLDLSKRRALAVKQYFTQVWGINESRISVEARNLPKEPSNPKELQGEEENRRVEILTDNLRILEPILTVDTLRKVERSKIIFFPNQKTSAGVENWKITLKQNSKIVREFSGKGTPPKQLEWTIDDKAFEQIVFGGTVDVEYNITDSLGQIGKAIAPPIAIHKITVDKKRLEGVTDKEYEYYSLILFDFAKSKLGLEHKSVLDFINRRVSPLSQVTIEGFTDNIGEEKVNKKISEKRAIEVAKWLGLKNARTVGVGEDLLLYDNSLPEGRFYCRTVKITIETPIVNNTK